MIKQFCQEDTHKLSTVEAPVSAHPCEAEKHVHNWSWELMGRCKYRVYMEVLKNRIL